MLSPVPSLEQVTWRYIVKMAGVNRSLLHIDSVFVARLLEKIAWDAWEEQLPSSREYHGMVHGKYQHWRNIQKHDASENMCVKTSLCCTWQVSQEVKLSMKCSPLQQMLKWLVIRTEAQITFFHVSLAHFYVAICRQYQSQIFEGCPVSVQELVARSTTLQ